MKHVLALDQAVTRIGYAIGSVDMEKPLTGVFVPPLVGARHGALMAALRDWLDMQIKVYHVQKVIYEAPFAGKNAQVFATVNKMLGIIELVCDDHEIPCVQATAPQWRKRFLGLRPIPKHVSEGLTKSAARSARRAWLKKAAMDACAARGWPVMNDDEADACGLLDFELAQHSEAYRTRSFAQVAA